MPERLIPWSPVTEVTNKVKIDDLEIEFKRTIRVPFGIDTNRLPPDMGSFPLYKVDDYAEKLPLSMAKKGGLFVPMYQREAMYISFRSTHRYAIKIFVGGINAVSEEPIVPDAATLLRRRALLFRSKSMQDYIVAPHQLSLDGIWTKPGNVHQIVATPTETGHSIEAQMTGEEKTSGIQFEITRLDLEPDWNKITIIAKTSIGNSYPVEISRHETVRELKDRIRPLVADWAVEIDLISGGKQLEDDKTLNDYNIVNKTLVEIVTRLRGIITPPSIETPIAPGGFIKQGIVHIMKDDYQKTVPVTFNIQILNSASFKHVTGKEPPQSSITVKSYTNYGYPFSSIYEESTTSSGSFSRFRSGAQVDQEFEESLPNDVPIVDNDAQQARPRVKIGSIGLLNPRGSGQKLELEWEMEERVREMQPPLY